MEWIKKHINPTTSKSGDCVINSIAIAQNKTWVDVYDELCRIGRETNQMPNDMITIQSYLKGYTQTTYKAVKGKPRMKVKDMNTGLWVLRLANHLTVVKDNVCFDKWDCRGRTVYRAWKIGEEESVLGDEYKKM